MNPALLAEEETKTIKYLNKHDHLQDQNSQSATERQYEEELMQAKKIFNGPTRQKQACFDSKALVGKAVALEFMQYFAYPKDPKHNLVMASKSKHKKGKSMDFQEFKANSKEEGRTHPPVQERNKNKVTINMNFINDFRSRNSISQMKEYNFSKKIAAHKQNFNEEGSTQRKKKSKLNKDGIIKQVKKEIKQYIDFSPINNKKKEKVQAKSGSKSFKQHISKGQIKSSQLYTDRKCKSTQRQKNVSKNGTDLKDISYSMPITSKMVSLYSNTTSVFSSKKQLDPIDRGHSYVIPTEQSLDELPQIRQYESFALSKRNSDSLRNLRKISLMQQLDETEFQSSKLSTSNIIHQYLQMFSAQEESEPQMQSKDFEEISQIPHQNSLKQKNQELQQDVLHGLANFGSEELKLDKSILLGETNQQITQQKQSLQKLNELIDFIQKRKGQNIGTQKLMIMDKIKQLVQQSGSKMLQQTSKFVKSEALVEVNNIKKENTDQSKSDIKEQISQDQNMAILNLEMLDRALRERQAQLEEKRDRELLRLQQSKQEKHEKEVDQQKQKIIKWMNHQIKEVVHTRTQLWKGFNFARHLLTVDEPNEHNHSNSKKKEMMRCLSDKYLARSSNKFKKNKKNKKDYSEQKLSDGRISKIEEKKQEYPQLKQQHGLQQKQQEQPIKQDFIRLSPSQQEHNFKQYQKKIQNQQQNSQSDSQSSDQSSSEPSGKKILCQPIRLPQPVSTDIIASNSNSGLNLQKLVCQIEYEDSFNQDDLQNMTKQSQQAKNKSLQLPLFQLSLEDKEDIYQFIFLDLCIELTDQYPLDSPVMKRIFAFIKNIKEQSKKQKGFKTNTNAIKDYLFQFVSYLKTQNPFLEEVHSNLDKPLGPTALDILKYMHAYEDEPLQEQSNETVFILDIKLFEQFQQTYLHSLQFQKYYDDEEKEKKRKIFLKNAIHIHNKAIFDALNQTLDKERPFGVWGEPFSWKKIAKFYHPRDAAIKNSIILKSSQKTIEYGAYMCGFIVDKQDCNLKNNPNVTQAYIDQIHDDRLSRMLANQLQQSQEKMLFIDDQQTQILVQVAQVIMQNLVGQFCNQLSSLL